MGIGVCGDGARLAADHGADPDDVDIPPSLDPDSDLVKQLLSTERGRQTLQWLVDNNIPIVIDPDENGAYWDGSQMVLGESYDSAAVVVHETNHARPHQRGVMQTRTRRSRDDYVAAAVERGGGRTVEQIQAAKEFGSPGSRSASSRPRRRTPRPTPGHPERSDAGQAERAGRDAVRDEFYNGNIVTSTTGDPYPDYYGDYWDSVH